MPISVTAPVSLRAAAPPLRGLVRQTLAFERRTAKDIAIVLADDALLRELNRRYRGKDRATDVLSFEYVEMAGARGSHDLKVGARAPGIQGDLVVSLDRVREQARRFRVSQGRELARLVVHGALHLAGHDHHRAGERRIMRAAEQRALHASGRAIARLERALAPTRRGR